MVNHMVQQLDRLYSALADATRRDVLVRLGEGPATIGELAEPHQMSLTGMKKHVQVLEDAHLVATEKVGRVRTCTLGTRDLSAEAAWIEKYQEMLNARYNRLDAFLERTKGDAP